MLRFALIATCFIAVVSYSYVEKRAYRECIAEHSDGHLFTKQDVRRCNAVAKLADDANRLALKYFVGLGNWKNGIESLSDALLPTFAPCARRSKNIAGKWTNMFEARQDNEVVIVRPSQQSWSDDVGVMEFAVPAPEIDLSMLVAAELLLHRSSPSSVGETYGRYDTSAILVNSSNATETRLHNGVQTSCSSTRGELMVLDLDVTELRNAMLDNSSRAVRMQVSVHARQQYIVGLRRTRLSIIQQTVGLVLHVKLGGGVSSHLVDAVSMAIGRNDTAGGMDSRNSTGNEATIENVEPLVLNDILAVRNRRSLYPDPRSMSRHATPAIQRHRQCRRTAHHFDRQLYRDMRIFSPAWHTRHFDIGLCQGECTFPYPDATNHGIAITRSGNKLCCAAVSFNELPLHVTIYHPVEHPTMRQVSLSDLKTTACGCR